ncbi:3-deoxy-7-phosphoheptulonate synthase [Morganella morganii]|uniref:3-deoxy-7-phosphoheptulonate synthase n=1 Tax=Morganella morganii TaxID=582 RepID=UPI00319F67D2
MEQQNMLNGATGRPWTPAGWTAFPAEQQPDYSVAGRLNDTVAELQHVPGLVSIAEIHALRQALRQVGEGRAFILQCGDCAESFSQCRDDVLRNWTETMQTMADNIGHGLGLPVVKIGRIAGQYAKPRSSPEETRNGITLPSYRGDIINGHAFSSDARTPSPERMLNAYYHAAVTLNALRGSGTFPAAETAQDTLFQPYYISHEALLLPYETALTRRHPADNRWYNCGAHTVWLGDRTNDPSQAHAEYLRGIENPVGIKCGPSMTPEKLGALLTRLNPGNQPGRIMLIVRMGADNICEKLPPLIAKAAADNDAVIWLSDPMHGNTRSTADNLKTRDFSVVYREAGLFVQLLRAAGMHPGGLHLEMTGQPVTECTGGPQKITDQDVGACYESLCDPRLNAAQATELVRLLSGSAGW